MFSLGRFSVPGLNHGSDVQFYTHRKGLAFTSPPPVAQVSERRTTHPATTEESIYALDTVRR